MQPIPIAYIFFFLFLPGALHCIALRRVESNTTFRFWFGKQASEGQLDAHTETSFREKQTPKSRRDGKETALLRT